MHHLLAERNKLIIPYDSVLKDERGKRKVRTAFFSRPKDAKAVSETKDDDLSLSQGRPDAKRRRRDHGENTKFIAESELELITKTNLAFLQDPRGSTELFRSTQDVKSGSKSNNVSTQDSEPDENGVYHEKVLTVAQAAWRLRSFTEREQKECSAKVIKCKRKLAAFRTKISEKSRQIKHQAEALSGIENEVKQLQEAHNKNLDQLASCQKEVTFQQAEVQREQNRHRYLVSCMRELSVKVDTIRQTKFEWGSNVSRAKKNLQRLENEIHAKAKHIQELQSDVATLENDCRKLCIMTGFENNAVSKAISDDLKKNAGMFFKKDAVVSKTDKISLGDYVGNADKPNEIIYHQLLAREGFVFFDFFGKDEIYYNPQHLNNTAI